MKVSRYHARIAAVAMSLALSASSAHAAVTPSKDAMQLATAMAGGSSLVTGASFVQTPASGSATAVADGTVAGFPRRGDSYAVISTGNTGSIFGTPGRNLSTDNGGGATRGNTAYDITVLKIDVMVPTGQNCLGFETRFFSEEFPEFPGKVFNDAFVAELDIHDWTTLGSTVIAPHNFAFRTDGTALNVRTTGDTSSNAANASGTRFDGATPLARAWTPAAPGPHSLYISLFDQGDATYDSAVFLDRLTTRRARNGSCRLGAFPIVRPNITLPPPTQTINGRTNFRARINSESRITRTVVRLDGKAVFTRNLYPDNQRNFHINVPINTAGLRRGGHELTYVVVNKAGVTTATRKFRR